MTSKSVKAVLLVALSCFLTLTSLNWKVEASEPIGTWAICVTQGWEADCGYYDLYGAGSESDIVVNRVVGGAPQIADGKWNCAADPVNKCRAVRTGSVTPEYFSATTTTSSTAPNQDGGSSNATTTTMTPQPASGNPCIDPSNPNYSCGWAAVSSSGFVSGVVACTYEVCGSGFHNGQRYVLQTRQEVGGNIAGYGQIGYDFATNRFYPYGWNGPWFIGGDTWEGIRASLQATTPTTTTTTTVTTSTTTPSTTTPTTVTTSTTTPTTTTVTATVPTTTTTPESSITIEPTTTSSVTKNSSASSAGGGSSDVAYSASSTSTAVPNGKARLTVEGTEVESLTVVKGNTVSLSVGEIKAEVGTASTPSNSTSIESGQGLVLSSGESANVAIGGFLADSEVLVVIHSEPRSLGLLQVNRFGEVVASIQIPNDMEAGPHTLVLTGLDKFGKKIELKFGLVIYSPDSYVPIWIWFLIGFLVLAQVVVLATRRTKSGRATI